MTDSRLTDAPLASPAATKPCALALTGEALDDAARAGRLDAEDRLAAAATLFRDPTLAEALHDLVERAAASTAFPMAMASVVLRRTQRFLAAVGLPPDLEASRATDRSISVCQHVVASSEPLACGDLLSDARFRRELSNSYGVRSYVGVPLRFQGRPIGSFCVVDVLPRSLDRELELLTPLALEAEQLLEERHAARARGAERAPGAGGLATAEAIAHLRDLLCRVALDAGAIEAAISDLRGGGDLLSAAARGELQNELLARNARVLREAGLAAGDAHGYVAELRGELQLAARLLDAVERAAIVVEPKPGPAA